MADYPIYYKNEGMKYRSRPEELKETILRYYPLTREFIDWMIKQGFKIKYVPNWKEGMGAVWWSLRTIAISSQGGRKIKLKVLFHEIVHILIPGLPNPYEHLREKEKYEEVIDEVADVYLGDPELVRYIRQKKADR